MSIQPFARKHTQALFEGENPRQFQNFRTAAIRKLTQLDYARTLEFLCSPPGNRQHSIRINDRWRICFVWTDNGPERVEIVNYH